MDTPTPAQVKSARDAVRHAMHQAAEVIGVTQGAWKKWEYAERAMPAGLYELYLLKTGQHADLELTPRR